MTEGTNPGRALPVRDRSGTAEALARPLAAERAMNAAYERADGVGGGRPEEGNGGG